MKNFDAAEFQKLAADASNGRSTRGLLLDYMATLHPIGQLEAESELKRRGVNVDLQSSNSEFPLPIIIDLAELTFGAKQTAESIGLSIPILHLICTDQIGFAGNGGSVAYTTSEEVDAEAAIHQESGIFGFRKYFQPFFQAGGLVTIDPFTGQRLVSTHSFVFEHLHIAYRFSGLETFYVVVGGIGSVVRFCCFPRLNYLVLANVPGEQEDHKQWSRGLHQRLMNSILRHSRELMEVFAMPRHATAVALGSWPNLGHFIWQELSGLEEVLQLHGHRAVKHVLLGPYAYLPVTELFPEIADRHVDNYIATDDMFTSTFHMPYQHIRPVNALIRPRLRERIIRVCEARVASTAKARMASLKSSRFVFWITLRAHNKFWVRQVDGHVEVVHRLARDVPNLAVVFDGWTDTREVAEAIRAGLNPQIEVIDTIGCDIFETFLWARAAHLYSSVVSTGLHFTAHFAGCPGVAHANSQHLKQRAFWQYLSPGSRPPTLLDPSEVNDISDGGLYDSYDFEPELLYRRLRSLIEEHYPERMFENAWVK